MKSASFAMLLVLAAYGITSAAAEPYATVADAIKALPQTTNLAARISTSALASTVSDPNLVATVFAPNNAAMAALQKTLSDFDADGDNSDLLNAALNYHVVPGAALTSDMLTNGMVLKTSQGESLKVVLKEGNVFIAGSQTYPAQVVSPNILAGKSVVHLINGVLLPTDSADLINAINDGAPAPAVEPVTPTPAATPAATPTATPAATPVPAPVDTPMVAPVETPAATPAPIAEVDAPAATPAPTADAAKATSGAAGVSVAAAIVALPALLALVL